MSALFFTLFNVCARQTFHSFDKSTNYISLSRYQYVLKMLKTKFIVGSVLLIFSFKWFIQWISSSEWHFWDILTNFSVTMCHLTSQLIFYQKKTTNSYERSFAFPMKPTPFGNQFWQFRYEKHSAYVSNDCKWLSIDFQLVLQVPQWKIDGRLFNIPFHHHFKIDDSKSVNICNLIHHCATFRKPFPSIPNHQPNVLLSFYGVHTVRWLTFQFNAALFVNWKLESHYNHQLPDILTAFRLDSVVTHPIVGLNFFFYYTLCHKQHSLIVYTGLEQTFVLSKLFLDLFVIRAHHIPSVFVPYTIVSCIYKKDGKSSTSLLSRRYSHHYYCNHLWSTSVLMYPWHLSTKKQTPQIKMFLSTPFIMLRICFVCFVWEMNIY